MNNENKIMLIGLGIMGILLLGIFIQGTKDQQIIVGNEVSKISVSGNAEKEVMPDKALIGLTVITEGLDAKKVQNDNSAKMSTVIEALKSLGVNEEDIATSNYYLYPWEEWDAGSQKMVKKGYRLTNTITVTTLDVSKAGEILDTVVAKGVNNVNDVRFTLSDKLEKEVKAELISEASKMAKQKAENLADSLDVSLGGVIRVSESSYSGGTYYANYAKSSVPMAEAMDTRISPEKVTVNLQVNVDYIIK